MRFQNFFISNLVCYFLLLQFISGKVQSREFEYAHAKVITESGISINVEVSDTPEKRSLGLGKRDKLLKGWGMLFVFQERIPHHFWMKDMQFPIDIIWIDNLRIIDLAENVPPPENGDSPEVFKPTRPSNFVLEIEAGGAKALGLKLGQKLRYQF